MLVPALRGGLGNQMFTIAATYSKSLDLKCNMAINYNLSHYVMQGNPPAIYKNEIYKNIPETDYIPKKTYVETDWAYSPIPDETDLLIEGYLQSSKHFESHTKQIQNLFFFSEQTKIKIENFLKKFTKKTIGIHIRLGDYLKPDCLNIHFLCQPNYFETALKLFDLNNYEIIICTDTPSSIKQFINLKNIHIMENNNEIEDLYLLSQCDNIIMSNSTFSWWGSFLGKTKEKTCAPNRWFGPGGPPNYKDIYQDNWIQIPV
jgi:hypothetical protein